MRLKKVKIKRISLQDLPEVSEERIRQLSFRAPKRKPGYVAHGLAIKGTGKAWLDGLQTLVGPQDPGIFFLWEKNMVVYVGTSEHGVLGLKPSNHAKKLYRAGRVFDRISFLPCAEEMREAACAAFRKYLRPKYGKLKKGEYVMDADREILSALGFPVER